MSDRLPFVLRVTGTLLLLTACAAVMTVVATLTLFQCRRLYSRRLATPCGRLVLRLWGIRMLVHQDAPFPLRQTVFISNHTSTADLFALVALGLPNVRFFLSGYLRALVPLGIIGYLTGIFWTVPQIHPERRTRIFQRAERILRRSGESVYLSPEGTRITTDAIGHFNKGAFHLATALHAPIVPIYILIPRAIDPGRGLHARPGDMHVYIRAPIETADWRIADLEKNRSRMREFYVEWKRELERRQ
ncbi:MAG: 1-acyl-sn-glycerol-3-phosphate acyltransferase [Burkholderiales bacterium]|nr:1-acyl-sn-glycerol-3-phosphate acyltransferase [Burkholderiales bacterium]